MYKNIIFFCKYIYEKISDRFNNLIVDHRSLLEENSYYCRMTDGNFSLNTDKDISQNSIPEKIKERMENYRK